MVQLIQSIIHNLQTLRIRKTLLGHLVAGVGKNRLNGVDLGFVFLHTCRNWFDSKRFYKTLHLFESVKGSVTDTTKNLIANRSHDGEFTGYGFSRSHHSVKAEFLSSSFESTEALCRFFQVKAFLQLVQ